MKEIKLTGELTKWVTYPEIYPTIDEIKKHFNMQEKEIITPEELSIPKLENLGENVGEVEEILVDAETQDELNEERELTDEEKKELKVKYLKDSIKKFHPIVHGVEKTVGVEKESDFLGRGTRIVKKKEIVTNETTNQFGKEYKSKRKRKKKLTKQSRRANR